MSIAARTPAAQAAEIVYPDSDGAPLAETPIHIQAIILLLQALQDWFKARPDVYVAADMFWYWEKGNPAARRAPDVMVIKGVGQRDRRSFLSWEENNAVPTVTVDVTSIKTWQEDYFAKRRLYQQLGVREYFLFDPEALCLRPALQGFRLCAQGVYVSLEPDEEARLYSEEMGLYLQAEGQRVRLRDGATGAPILSREEKVALLELRAAELQARLDERNGPAGTPGA
jgi:Uma2 family endonuclease